MDNSLRAHLNHPAVETSTSKRSSRSSRRMVHERFSHTWPALLPGSRRVLPGFPIPRGLSWRGISHDRTRDSGIAGPRNYSCVQGKLFIDASSQKVRLDGLHFSCPSRVCFWEQIDLEDKGTEEHSNSAPFLKEEPLPRESKA